MKWMPSWSQKTEVRTFPGDSLTWNFFGRGGVSRYAVTPFIVVFFGGHSDITRFRAWSPVATGNHLNLVKKFQILLRRVAKLTFVIRVQIFRDPLRGQLRMFKASWMMDPTRSRETLSCSAIDLAEIRRSSKITSWIWLIITGMVTVLCRLRRGALQV